VSVAAVSWADPDFNDQGEDFEEYLDVTSDNPQIQEKIDYVNSVLASGEPWNDPDFPAHCRETIVKPGESHPAWDFDSLSWTRASDLAIPSGVDGWGLFKDDPLPRDIKQGMLGDCYMLGAMGSLAEKPERVRQRFINKRKNKCGIYLLSVFINNIEVPMLVDDWILVDSSGSPHLAHNKRGKIWVMLLEKAWLKALGSYCRADGGNPCNPFQFWSGLPAFDNDR